MNELKNCERFIKRCLKKKVSFSQGLLVAFMIIGGFGFLSTPVRATWWITSENGSITGEGQPKGKSVILNPKDLSGRINIDGVGNQSVAVGYGATTKDNGVAVGAYATSDVEGIAVGNNSKAGYQGTTVGQNSSANKQSVAVGADVYAEGTSSIAIGSDDLAASEEKGKYNVKLPENTIYDIYSSLYKENGIMTKGDFTTKYVKNDTGEDKRIYSPTYAGGMGAIAIGSRTVAAKDLSTSIGSLSFALAEKSTAVGYSAFVDSSATGATAIGEATYAFSPNTIAIGNRTEATNEGTVAYGYRAKAVAKNSIAIGNTSAAGAKFNTAYTRPILEAYTKLSDADSNKETGAVLKEFDDKIGETFTSTNGELPLVLDSDDKTKLEIGDLKVKETIAETNAENAVVLGNRSFAVKKNSMAMGYTSLADADNALSIGSYSGIMSGSDNSLALGVGTVVTNAKDSMAIGTRAKVKSNSSMAIGTKATVESNSPNATAFGIGAKVTGKNSTAFGINALVNAENGLALGTGASVTVNNGGALGVNAKATIENSFAIGVDSETDYDTSKLEKDGWISPGALSIPTTKGVGVIAVGHKGKERRITNVASGLEGTDAVNVAQLKSIFEDINIRMDQIDAGNNFMAINDSEGSEANKLTGLLKLDKNYQKYIYLKTSLLNIKLNEVLKGEKYNEAAVQKVKDKLAEIKSELDTAKAFSSELVALDNIESEIKSGANYEALKNKLVAAENTANSTRPTAIDKVKLDTAKSESNYYNDRALGADSIALGYKANTDKAASNSISIGHETTTVGKNSVTLGSKSKNLGTDSIIIGVESTINGEKNIIVGNNVIGSGTNNNVVVLGSDITLTSGKNDGVILGNKSEFVENAVSVGTKVSTRKIVNVREGIIANDSNETITGKQLYDLGVTNLGLETGSENNTFTKHTFEKLKNSAGADSNIAKDSIVDIIDENRSKLNSGLKFSADSGNVVTNYLGSEIAIDSGDLEGDYKKKNLKTKISQGTDGKTKIEIGLKSIPTFEGVTIDAITLVTESGALKIRDNGGNKVKLTNLENGVIGTNSSDAVTGSQLYTLQEKTIALKGDTGTETTKKIGDNPVFKVEGNTDIATSSSSNGVKITLEKSTSVKEGENKVVTSGAVYSAIDGLSTTYAKLDASNLQDTDVKNWKNKLGVANLDLNYKAGDETTSKTVTLSKGLHFKGDKNLTATTEANGIINYKLNSGLKGITSLSESENGEKPISIASDKIDLNGRKIENLGSGNIENGSTDVVNGGDVHKYLLDNKYVKEGDLTNKLSNNFYNKTEADNRYVGKTTSITFNGDSGNTVLTLDKNNILNITGNNTNKDMNGSLGNIITKVEDGKVIISMSTMPKFEKINVAGVTIDTKDGTGQIHGNGFKIVNIADGEVAEGSKAAVNGGQLFDVKKIAVESNTLSKENKENIARNSTEIQSNKKSISNLSGDVTTNRNDIDLSKQNINKNANDISENKKDIDSNTRTIEKGLNIKATKVAQGVSSPYNIKLGDTIYVSGDDNITTTLKENGEINISLNNQLTFKSTSGTSNISINKDGNGKISGVVKGSSDTDVATVEQILPLAKALNSELKTDGTIVSPSYKVEGTSYTNIQNALDAINKTAKTGAEGVINFTDGINSDAVRLGESVKITSGSSDNLDLTFSTADNTFTVKIKENPTFDGKVKAVNGFDANNKKIENLLAGENDNDAINYAQYKALKNIVDKGVNTAVALTLEAPVTYTAKIDGHEEMVIKANDSNGTNPQFYKHTDIDDNGKARVDAKPLTADQLKTLKVGILNGDKDITKAIRFTNVAPGDIDSNSKDAINGSQLKPVLDSLGMDWNKSNNTINKPNWHIGKKIYNNINDVLKDVISGELGNTLLTTKDGDKVVYTNGKYYKDVDLNKDELEKGNYVPNSGADSVDKDNIVISLINPTEPEKDKTTKNPMRLANVGAGEKDTDAVNVKQLKDLGINVTSNSGDRKPVVTYDTSNMDKITFGDSNTKTLLTNIADGNIGENSSDAVTGGQLYTVNKEISANKVDIANISTKTWRISLNNNAGHQVKLGDEVGFKTDENIKLIGKDIQNSDGTTSHILTFGLKDNLTIGRINIENIKNTATDGSDNSIATITGLTNKTWNIDNITTGRAATEDQLKSALTSVKTESDNTNKFVVKYDRDTTNSTQPNKNLISLEGTTFNTNTPNTGTKITNLAIGDINENSSDAINGSQLYNMANSIFTAMGVGKIESSGKLTEKIEFNMNDNNGVPRKVSTIKEAIEDLNNGWRVAGGNVPTEGKFDTVGGATNVKRGETLAIVGGKNITTQVTKQVVKYRKEYTGDNIIVEGSKVYLATDTDKKQELLKKFVTKEGKEVDEKDVIFYNDKAYFKEDNEHKTPLSIIGIIPEDFEKMMPFLAVTISNTPEFNGMTITESGITVKNKDSSNSININTDGKGTITGLTNIKFTDTTGNDLALKDLTADNLNNLSITSGKSATEDQLREVIVDYIERDKNTVKYDSDSKDSLTLGGNRAVNGGVKIKNLKAGEEGTDATNMDQLIKLFAGDQSNESSPIKYDSNLNKWNNIGYRSLLNIDGTQGSTPANILSAINLNVDKLNSGFTFSGDIGTGTKQYLGSSLNINKSTTSIIDNSEEYVGDNLITKYVNNSGNGTLLIGLKKKPTFETLKLKKDNNSTEVLINSDNEGNLELSKLNPINPEKKSLVVIKGVVEGDTPDSVATKASVDDLKEQLGLNGKDGNNGDISSRATAGNDGLDGKSILEKIQTMREGGAGTTIYTTESGDRVRLSKDGKYYKVDEIRDLVEVDGKFYGKNQFENDGKTLKDNAQATSVDNIEPENIVISAVAPTGLANAPTTIRNLKNNIAKADELDNSNIKEDRAATVGDLKVLKNAGLNFKGNSGDLVNIGLSGTLKIEGKGTDINNFRAAEGNILVATNITKDGLDVTLNKNLNNIESISNGNTKLEIGDGKINLKKEIKDSTGNKIIEKVELTGIADGTTNDSVATVGQLNKKADKSILDNLKEKIEGKDGNGGIIKDIGTPLTDKDDNRNTTLVSDNMNGKNINDKVNAVRRGESGTVVYTTKSGERVVKGKDGKFYRADDMLDRDNAIPKAAANEINSNDIKLSLVGKDGATTTNTVLGNVADAEKDTDAVNLGQLNGMKKDFDKKLSNKVDNKEFDNLVDSLPIALTVENANGELCIVKSKNGKLYKKCQLDENGNPKPGAIEVLAEELSHSLTGTDGNVGNPSVLHNIANAEKDTDAVNLGQLKDEVKKSTERSVNYAGENADKLVLKENNGKGTKIENVADGEKDTDAVNKRQLDKVTEVVYRSHNHLNERMDRVEENVKELDNRVNLGVATAAAIGSLKYMDTVPGEVSVAAGLSNYRGAQAIAVGVQAAPSSNMRIHMQVGISSGRRTEAVTSIGGSWKFKLD